MLTVTIKKQGSNTLYYALKSPPGFPPIPLDRLRECYGKERVHIGNAGLYATSPDFGFLAQVESDHLPEGSKPTMTDNTIDVLMLDVIEGLPDFNPNKISVSVVTKGLRSHEEALVRRYVSIYANAAEVTAHFFSN